jgi:hypothetical protein
MRIGTPLATPAVPPPEQSADSITGGAQRPELTAPAVVLAPWGAMELEAGSFLIGRLPECDICVNDELVSRMHARVSVQDGHVLVEDLHSTNGVFVNRRRIQQHVAARDGDRLLVGSTELSLFQSRPAEPSVPRRPSPPVGTPLARLRPAPVPPAPRSEPTTALLPPAPQTTKHNALQLIGALADRLAADGSVQEAAEVLSEHLRGMQRGAIAGLVVVEGQVSLASQYALRLARWTSRPSWVDYVVELHLATGAMMTPDITGEFGVAAERFPTFDRSLLAYYVEQQRRRRPLLTNAERQRLDALHALASS